MGKSETATASIGIKILLCELMIQLNETNFAMIKKMICNGFIEDDNEFYNEVYKEIVGYNEGDIELPNDYLEFKNYLTDKFKNNGSYHKSKYSSKVEPDLSDGCLLDKELLFPIKEILSTERWGYDRYGINAMSRPLDFDLSVNMEMYNEIKNYTIVFILEQNTD
jgi:hypothetical protein